MNIRLDDVNITSKDGKLSNLDQVNSRAYKGLSKRWPNKVYYHSRYAEERSHVQEDKEPD